MSVSRRDKASSHKKWPAVFTCNLLRFDLSVLATSAPSGTTSAGTISAPFSWSSSSLSFLLSRCGLDSIVARKCANFRNWFSVMSNLVISGVRLLSSNNKSVWYRLVIKWETSYCPMRDIREAIILLEKCSIT